MSEIVAAEIISSSFVTRLWKHKNDITLDDFYNHIIVSCKPLCYEAMRIKGLGKKIDNEDGKIGELNLQDGEYFVLECKEFERTFITLPDEGKCESCYVVKKITHWCECKLVSYCSE